MQNTIRYALFLLIVSGLLFTACNTENTVQEELLEEPVLEEKVEDSEEIMEETTQEPEEVEDAGVYEDGTYAADGGYFSPAGYESVGVSLTIEDDVVSAVNVTSHASNEVSVNFQKLFLDGISAQVLGKSLDEIGGYSSVNGSSLTPDGFDEALASIKVEAAL